MENEIKCWIAEVRDRHPLEQTDGLSDLDPEESVDFTYYLHSAQEPIKEVAHRVALEETTGAWGGKGEPAGLFYSCQAKLQAICVYDRNDAVITIRSPLINMNLEDNLFDPAAQLGMLSVGGPIQEFVFYDQVVFMDFRLPQRLLRLFPGPKFGVRGTRRYIGLRDDEPIIGTIIKPCCGLTADEVARKASQAAMGGAVLMKDDEKMMNPVYCPLEEKVRKVNQVLEEVSRQTGKKVIYCPHISTSPFKIKELARKAVEVGATGLMFNLFVSGGLQTIWELAKDPDINVPLYIHTGSRSAISTGPRRTDDAVLFKWIRLMGGDYAQVGVAGQRECHVASRDQILMDRIVQVYRDEPIEGIKSGLPIMAGGLGATNLGENFETFGLDIGALAGSNMLYHPHGPTAGAKAMYQAYQAWRDNIPLREYALSHKELQVIL